MTFLKSMEINQFRGTIYVFGRGKTNEKQLEEGQSLRAF